MKIYSFGFKYEGEQPKADLNFDLRNKLKNPVSHLPKGAIGLDRIVIDTVLGTDQNKKVFETILAKIQKQMKQQGDDISVSFGCRSGIHRSVVFAEELHRRMLKSKVASTIRHIHLKSEGRS